MIYMAPMPESIQELAIKKLEPYKERIKELIDKKVVFLLVGNAVEVFGKYIENEDGSKIEALGLLDLYAKRDMMHRHNSAFIGDFEDIKVIGEDTVLVCLKRQECCTPPKKSGGFRDIFNSF